MYPHLYFTTNNSTKLPDEIINEILSYGDPVINEKYNHVLFQFKKHVKTFHSLTQNNHSIWFQFPCHLFHYYVLRQSYLERKSKFPNSNFKRFISHKITDENLIWVASNYMTFFPSFSNTEFWYDSLPYEPLIDFEMIIED